MAKIPKTFEIPKSTKIPKNVRNPQINQNLKNTKHTKIDQKSKNTQKPKNAQNSKNAQNCSKSISRSNTSNKRQKIIEYQTNSERIISNTSKNNRIFENIRSIRSNTIEYRISNIEYRIYRIYRISNSSNIEYFETIRPSNTSTHRILRSQFSSNIESNIVFRFSKLRNVE